MDIPDELNRLMAEFKRVTTRGSEPESPGQQPSANKIDEFLSQYGFDANVVIERIEITERGVFRCYMFAVWQPDTDELSLFQMDSLP